LRQDLRVVKHIAVAEGFRRDVELCEQGSVKALALLNRSRKHGFSLGFVAWLGEVRGVGVTGVGVGCFDFRQRDWQRTNWSRLLEDAFGSGRGRFGSDCWGGTLLEFRTGRY